MAEGGENNVKRGRVEEEEEEESSDEPMYAQDLSGAEKVLEDIDKCVKRAKRYYKKMCKIEAADDPVEDDYCMTALLFHEEMDTLRKFIVKYQKDTSD